ncbi:hybrid sensor histidine kinase/response regulator [Afifella pfennigii]|uniref:hybrid sensor histidine kinase/response regulator n=1 Tax=Afifella pfennigii TaxID=209897 RepID=UPI00047CEA84|nr:ATP-binding protein [Afifella pfennigii]
MLELSHLIESRQAWLVERTLHYAKRHGYAALSSTLLRPWQVSVQGLSEPMVVLIERGEWPPVVSRTADPAANPFRRFAVAEAAAHHDRGIPISQFVGLLKHYRAAFHDLLEEQGAVPAARRRYARFIDACFDAAEIAFLSVWEEVTPTQALRRSAEVNRILTREKNRYLTIFESLNEPVILLDEAGHPINSNHAAGQLFDAGAIPGRGYYADGQGQPFERQIADLLAKTGGDAETEIRIETRRGRRDFHVRTQRMLDVSEKFAGWVVILSDITEIRAAERAADAANHAKSAFLATMSHEVRTPINGLLGLTELLQATELDARQLQLVEGLQTSGEVLMDLVEDVLDYTRLESGALVSDVCDVVPRQLVDQIAAVFEGQCRRKGIRLHTQIASDCPAVTRVDQAKLRRILLNLTGNAVKFTDKGTVRLSVRPSRRGLCFSVADTGPGIPAGMRDRIFEPFVQHADAHRSHPGGTGLGLAICRRLAESLGARLDLEAGPEGGSVFTLDCPVEAAGGEAMPGRAASLRSRRAALPPAHILLVEDNAVNALVYEGLLSADGHAVDRVETAEAGLERLERTAYDLVVMDVRMAGMSGLEAVRRIRAGTALRLRQTPIVLTTADGREEAARAAAEAGANAFLAKPFTSEALRAAMRAAMEGGPAPIASPAAPGAVVSVLDIKVMDGHRAALGKSGANRLMNAFLGERSRYCAALKEVTRTNDAQTLARVAHGIRGGASIIGLTRLAEAAGKAEQAAGRSPLPAELHAMVAELRREIDDACQALRRLVAEQPGSDVTERA